MEVRRVVDCWPDKPKTIPFFPRRDNFSMSQSVRIMREMEHKIGLERDRRVETEVEITPLRGTCRVNTQDSPVSLNQGGSNRVRSPVGPGWISTP